MRIIIFLISTLLLFDLAFSSSNQFFDFKTFEQSVLKKYPDFQNYTKPKYFSRTKIEAYCLSKVLNVTDDIKVFALYSSPTKGYKKGNLISEYTYRFLYIIENYGNKNWEKNKRKLLQNYLSCVKELLFLQMK